MATPKLEGYEPLLEFSGTGLPALVDVLIGAEYKLMAAGQSALSVPTEFSVDRQAEIRHALIEGLHLLAAHAVRADERLVLYTRHDVDGIEYLLQLEGGTPIKTREFGKHADKLRIMGSFADRLNVERLAPGVRLRFDYDQPKAA